MDIEARIDSEWYIKGGDAPVNDFQPPVPARHPLRRLTVCMLVLKDGSVVIGESFFPGELEDFDMESGQRVARVAALEKLRLKLCFDTRKKRKSKAR